MLSSRSQPAELRAALTTGSVDSTSPLTSRTSIVVASVGLERDFESGSNNRSLAALTAINGFFLHCLFASTQKPLSVRQTSRGWHCPSTTCSCAPHLTSSVDSSGHCFRTLLPSAVLTL